AGGVKNSASYAAQGLPDAAIAQGSIFSVFGNNLGSDPAEFGFDYPLPAVTPGGQVSAAVTVNGTTTQAIILYAGKTQINAVLPSNTPVGSGTLAVTVNGQTSAAAPIEVTGGDFGIYTVNSAGSGPGIVTFADYSLVALNKAANPGEALILWGTGLGPVSGNEAGGALPGDQPNLPAQVYVGGMQASLLYRGRSGCCAGLDQIVFTVPAGVEGCAVPIAVRTGDKVSNFSTMSIAASGRACTDAATGLTSADFQKFLSNPSFTAGFITLSRTTSAAGSTDSGLAAFERLPGASFGPGSFNSVSLGGCAVTPSAATPFNIPGAVGLDAGSVVSIGGPGGIRTLAPSPAGGKGSYANAKLGDGTPGNFLDPGQYTISSPGGVDVGSFNAKATVPASLVWTNQGAITAVNPAVGQSITWSGGDPTGYIAIDGSSSNATAGAGFHCLARISDGSFTIPPIVLLSLPSGAGSLGSLSVGASTTTAFQTPSLDLGVATASTISSKNVTYGAAAQSGAPLANAGPNQAVSVGAAVQLNGSASSDPGGNPLTYQWSLTSVPAGSVAALSNAAIVNPVFTADRPGTYVAQLVVNNGTAASAPATVTITANASQTPTANAGPNQNVLAGATVLLDGSASSSPNKTPLTYAFTFVSRPAGSAATLTNANSVAPTFLADVAGNYVVQLIVNDGTQSSLPATVTITAAAAGAPASITASGGTPQTAQIGTAFASPLSVTVRDKNGNPVSGVTVTFTAPSTGASGSFGGVSTAVTNALGVALSPLFTANATAGTYLVTASAPGLATPASFSLTNTVARPSSITATGGTPQSAPVGTAFAAPLAVSVKDMTGNPVSGVTVTFAAPSTGASGSFAGGANTAVTNAAG
ncbi:MAG: PKD domain-containing protein, partial [Acidobacteriota bacterium]|nr:PKD domain-containing protein [Acidobacteriota bacterium]